MTRRQQVEDLLTDLATVRHSMIARKQQGGLQLSPAQREILHYVHTADEPITISEIASAAGISNSAVTQHLDDLEDHGYVKRSPSDTDRRSVVVTISATGQKQIDKANEVATNHLLELFSVLSDKEIASFSQIIHKLANATQDKD